MNDRKSTFLVAAFLLELGCKDGAEEPAPMASEQELECDIRELFLQSCNGGACHGGGASSAAMLDLISPNVEERVADVPGTTCDGLLADLSDPKASLLYTKVTEPTCGLRMPVDGSPLEEDQLTCMQYWIAGLLPPSDDCTDCACEPGAVEDCYGGPEGTANIGECKSGTHTCETSGMAWRECEGEVRPAGENCLTPDVDEDCDGKTPDCSEVWARQFADPEDQAIRSLAVDPDNGDIYIFGDFEGTVSFGGEPLTAELAEPVKQDLVIAKFDLYGNPIWSRRFGDSSTQIAVEMAIDPDGNLVFVGRMYGTIDVGGGTLKAKGGNDILIFKLNSEGNHVWSRLIGGNQPDRAVRLAFDPKANVILTGAFTGKVDFDVGKYIAVGERDAFVTKLDRNTGEPTFAMQIGGLGDDYGFGVDVDPSGEVIIAGRFGAPLELGGQELAHAGDLDIYLARLDDSGQVLWARSFGGPGKDEIHDLRLQQDGDIVLLGAISDSVDFGGSPLVSAGVRDMFLATLDGQGGHVWSASYGDAVDQFETDGTDTWLTLVLAANGDIHVGGTLYGTLDFGAGGHLTASGSKADVFHAQFDPDGDYIGGWRFGGAGSDYGHDIAVTESGYVLHCGRSSGNKFSVGDIASFPNAGRSDGFLAKLAPL